MPSKHAQYLLEKDFKGNKLYTPCIYPRITKIHPHHSEKQIARYQRQKLGMIKNSCGREHIGKVHETN